MFQNFSKHSSGTNYSSNISERNIFRNREIISNDISYCIIVNHYEIYIDLFWEEGDDTDWINIARIKFYYYIFSMIYVDLNASIMY